MILVKMDVEGEEYATLPALVARGGCSHVRALTVEWHSRKLLGHGMPTIAPPAELPGWLQSHGLADSEGGAGATAPRSSDEWENWLKRTLGSPACGIKFYDGIQHTRY